MKFEVSNYLLLLGALPHVCFKLRSNGPLIIDDKSLPHKPRRSFTRLLIFKIKFSSEPPTQLK